MFHHQFEMTSKIKIETLDAIAVMFYNTEMNSDTTFGTGQTFESKLYDSEVKLPLLSPRRTFREVNQLQLQ